MNAKEMFENIEMFGVKGRYTISDEGNPQIEWSTSRHLRAMIIFDLGAKDFETFIVISGLTIVPLNINKQLLLAIYQQMKELEWI